MSGELEAVVREMFDAIDRNDADAVMRTGGDGMQGIDEISRHWMRGLEEVGAYVKQMTQAVQDAHSEIQDVRETMWGDTGLLTCWLQQDYMLGGQRQQISAPTTVVLRRQDGDWRIVLFHSIPLLEGPES